MKFLLCAIALASTTFAAQAAPATPIDDLYNTSWTTSEGQQDTHYTVTTPAGKTTQGWSTDTDTGYPVKKGPWIDNSQISSWDTPSQNPAAHEPVGHYLWKTTFNLTGYDAATASFDGRFAADGNAIAYLNGHEIGVTPTKGYSSWSSFAANSQYFVAGLNTVSFNVHNLAGATGLRVEFLQSEVMATAPVQPQAVEAIPEPETYALMLAGLAALGVVARRRKAA